MGTSKLVGQVRQVHGSLVDVSLEAGAEVSVGQKLEIPSRSASLAVVSRQAERGIRCAVLSESISVGDAVHDNGKRWTQELNADQLARLAADRAALSHPSREIVETGLKCIDFLCPLRQGGSLALLGGAFVGKTVLATELAKRLPGRFEQVIHVPFARPMQTPLTDVRRQAVDDGMPARDRDGDVEWIWTMCSVGADPTFADGAARSAFDAVIFLSVSSSVRTLYPAIDGAYTTSRPLLEGWVDAEHARVHTAFLTALSETRRLTFDSHFWELIAQGAHGAARDRVARVEEALTRDGASRQAATIRRVRKVEAYLTQPLYCTEPFTGMPGVDVSRAETVRTVAAILDGAFDHVGDRDLYLKGSVSPNG